MPRKQPPHPPSRVLDKPQLEAAIRTLEKRIGDLKTFDVSPIQERWDPRVEALETKISASLAEIFGEGTPEYYRHSIGTLDDLPVSMMGGRYSPQQIQASLRVGIEGAVVKLGSLRHLLAERLEEVAAPAEPPGTW